MNFYLQLAATVALNDKPRAYYLGAVGLRSDGTLVASPNGACEHPMPSAHAEARVARKLDKHAVIYVSRVTRSGKIAIAKPCKNCEKLMRLRKVARCYYTIDENEYGCIEF